MLLRNSALNLAGFVLPLALAVVAFPFLLNEFGVELFGLLTLLWALLSYFGILDLGLSRAVTHRISSVRGSSETGALASEVAQANTVAFLGSVIAGAGLVLVAAPIARLLAGPHAPDVEQQAGDALIIAAMALPLVVTSSICRGVLEAEQDFARVAILRVVTGSLLFAGPVASIVLGFGFEGAVWSLVLARVVALAMAIGFCRSVFDSFRFWGRPRARTLSPLLRTGGWMTVSNVVSPLLAYADRFVLGAAAGMAAVGYYATASEVVTKLWLVSGAITGALFPEFSRLLGCGGSISELYAKAQKLIFAVVMPVVLAMTAFADEGLALWMGREFADSAAPAFTILAASMLVSCVAQIPFTVVQSAGRADLTAKFHLAICLPYVFVMYAVAGTFGATGAAWVWFGRIVVDLYAMTLMARTVEPQLRRSGASIGWTTAVIAVAAAASSMYILETLSVRAAIFAAATVAVAALLWGRILTPGERGRVLGMFRRKIA